MKTLRIRISYCLGLFCLLTSVQVYAQNAPTTLSVETERALKGVTDRLCDCYAEHGDLADGSAYQECLVKPLFDLDAIAEGLAKNHPEQMRALLDAVEEAEKACKARDHHRPINEERRARLRVAYHQDVQQRIDSTDPLQMAEELGQLMCDCHGKAGATHELPCDDKLEILMGLLQMRYQNQAETWASIQQAIGERMAGCNGTPSGY